MDGLELSRKLNQDYPNIYIILCTGFDEFEYAKEAVHLDIKAISVEADQCGGIVRKSDETEGES